MEEKLRAALNEKHLVIYASLRGVLLNLVTSFRRKYKELPIHVHFFSSHPIPIYERVKAEISARLPTADVVIVPQYMILQMEQEGLLRDYRSPEFSAFPQGFYSGGGWAAMAVEPIVVVHSTGLKSSLPTNSDDFTDSRWRGRMATQTVTSFSEGMMGAYFLVTLRREMGPGKWDTFLQRLSNLKPVAYECLLHMTHALARGEQDLGFPATLRKASLADAVEPGGLGQVYLSDFPEMASFRTVALVRKGLHPNVADLFFDFALSKEWQMEMGEKLDGMVPARPGIETNYWVSNPLFHGFTYFPSKEEINHFDDYVTAFREAGLK